MKSLDLIVLQIYVLLVSLVLLIRGQGTFVSVLLVILVPGYVSVAAMFPANDRIDTWERVALSVGLSIVIVPLLGLVLGLTPVGIGFESTVVSILGFSTAVGILAYLRRMQVLTQERGSPSSPLNLPRWRDFSGQEKALAGGLSIAAILSVIVLITAASNPAPQVGFTEFGILGPDGELGGYPTSLNVSEFGRIMIFVINHEFQIVNYTLKIDLIELEETNGTNELNRTVAGLFNLTLSDGEEWIRPYTFSIDAPGLWKIEFLLFRDGDTDRVYRNLNLFIEVGNRS